MDIAAHPRIFSAVSLSCMSLNHPLCDIKIGSCVTRELSAFRGSYSLYLIVLVMYATLI